MYPVHVACPPDSASLLYTIQLPPLPSPPRPRPCGRVYTASIHLAYDVTCFQWRHVPIGNNVSALHSSWHARRPSSCLGSRIGDGDLGHRGKREGMKKKKKKKKIRRSLISIEKKSFLQIPTEEEGRRGIPFVSISFVSPLEEDKGEGITGWSSSRYIDYSRIDLSPWTTDREKVFGGYASIRSEGGREEEGRGEKTRRIHAWKGRRGGRRGTIDTARGSRAARTCPG